MFPPNKKKQQKNNELLAQWYWWMVQEFQRKKQKTANVRKAEKSPSKEEGKTSKVKLNKKIKFHQELSHAATQQRMEFQDQLPLFILFICNIF